MFILCHLFMGLSAKGEAAFGIGQCGGGSSRDLSSQCRRNMRSSLIPCCRFPSCALCSSGVVNLHHLPRDTWDCIKFVFSEAANNFPKAGVDRRLKPSFRARFAYDIAHCFSCVFRQKVLHSKIWE